MLPKWLAPNLITLIGITGLVLAFLVTATMVPEIEGNARHTSSCFPIHMLLCWKTICVEPDTMSYMDEHMQVNCYP